MEKNRERVSHSGRPSGLKEKSPPTGGPREGTPPPPPAGRAPGRREQQGLSPLGRTCMAPGAPLPGGGASPRARALGPAGPGARLPPSLRPPGSQGGPSPGSRGPGASSGPLPGPRGPGAGAARRSPHSGVKGRLAPSAAPEQPRAGGRRSRCGARTLRGDPLPAERGARGGGGGGSRAGTRRGRRPHPAPRSAGEAQVQRK